MRPRYRLETDPKTYQPRCWFEGWPYLGFVGQVEGMKTWRSFREVRQLFATNNPVVEEPAVMLRLKTLRLARDELLYRRLP